MNGSENLRLKSSYGNRTLDERRDKRIETNLKTGRTEIKEKTTAGRAAQAYRGAVVAKEGYKKQHGRESSQLETLCDQLGNMTFNDGRRGRPKKVKNL